jgi:hypothetical protein
MSIIRSIGQTVSLLEEQKIATMLLAEVNSKGEPVARKTRYFQYFPETIQDTRSVDYIQKNPVGSSHPLYQWVQSNARTISFTCIFSADDEPEIQNQNRSLGETIEELGATISGVLKNPIAAAIDAATGFNNSGEDK